MNFEEYKQYHIEKRTKELYKSVVDCNIDDIFKNYNVPSVGEFWSACIKLVMQDDNFLEKDKELLKKDIDEFGVEEAIERGLRRHEEHLKKFMEKVDKEINAEKQLQSFS